MNDLKLKLPHQSVSVRKQAPLNPAPRLSDVENERIRTQSEPIERFVARDPYRWPLDDPRAELVPFYKPFYVRGGAE